MTAVFFCRSPTQRSAKTHAEPSSSQIGNDTVSVSTKDLAAASAARA